MNACETRELYTLHLICTVYTYTMQNVDVNNTYIGTNITMVHEYIFQTTIILFLIYT